MKGNKRFWNFQAAAGNPKVGELMLYGIISSESWWGDEVTPKQFKADLDALGDIDELHVYINSDGGDVFAGQAIHSMLKRHKARVVVYVDGLAASIASVIAMAGEVVRMPKNAMMMIHNPWTMIWDIPQGNEEEFRRWADRCNKMADDLNKIRESIIAAYMGKCDMDRDKLIEMLDAETWLTAEECVAMGFADEYEEAKQVAACRRGEALVINGQEMDLSKFKHPPTLAFLPAEQPAPANPPPATGPAAELDPPPVPDPVPEIEPVSPVQRQPRNVAPLSVFERQLQMNERGM